MTRSGRILVASFGWLLLPPLLGLGMAVASGVHGSAAFFAVGCCVAVIGAIVHALLVWRGSRRTKIYQNNRAVGDVDSEVSFDGRTFVFDRLSNTSALRLQEMFVYRGQTIRILRVGAIVGTELRVLGEGKVEAVDVLHDVLCEVVRK